MDQSAGDEKGQSGPSRISVQELLEALVLEGPFQVRTGSAGFQAQDQGGFVRSPEDVPGLCFGTLRAELAGIRMDLDGEPTGGVEELDEQGKAPLGTGLGTENLSGVFPDQAIQAGSLQGAVQYPGASRTVVVEPKFPHRRIVGQGPGGQPGPIRLAPKALFDSGGKEKGVGPGKVHDNLWRPVSVKSAPSQGPSRPFAVPRARSNHISRDRPRISQRAASLRPGRALLVRGARNRNVP